MASVRRTSASCCACWGEGDRGGAGGREEGGWRRIAEWSSTRFGDCGEGGPLYGEGGGEAFESIAIGRGGQTGGVAEKRQADALAKQAGEVGG